MTADERIEKLLNRFGQTISDLPKAENYKWNDKYEGSKNAASNCVEQWYGHCSLPEEFSDEALPAYICHLADVIDRMEIALETATECVSCFPCVNAYGHCNGSCDFMIDDKYLSDVSQEEVTRYIDDAD